MTLIVVRSVGWAASARRSRRRRAAAGATPGTDRCRRLSPRRGASCMRCQNADVEQLVVVRRGTSRAARRGGRGTSGTPPGRCRARRRRTTARAAVSSVAARLRQLAEVAVGEQAQLVVVVEDQPAVARDAEVLEQHVAGEDVRRREVAQHLAVVDHRVARRVGRRPRAGRGRAAAAGARCRGARSRRSSLAHSHGLARPGRAARASSSGEKPRRSNSRCSNSCASTRRPGAVVAEHQPVLVAHLLVRDRLRVVEAVADHLEDDVEARAA